MPRVRIDRNRVQKAYLVTDETAAHVARIAQKWKRTEGEVLDAMMRQFLRQKGVKNGNGRSTGNQHP